MGILRLVIVPLIQTNELHRSGFTLGLVRCDMVVMAWVGLRHIDTDLDWSLVATKGPRQKRKEMPNNV